MTATDGYVWFLPSWFPENWFDTDNLNKEKNATEKVPCTTEEMIRAINGHMSLAYKYYGDDNSIMQENISIKEWREKYRLLARKQVSLIRFVNTAKVAKISRTRLKFLK